jgi:hypothetical protein
LSGVALGGWLTGNTGENLVFLGVKEVITPVPLVETVRSDRRPQLALLDPQVTLKPGMAESQSPSPRLAAWPPRGDGATISLVLLGN